MFALQKTLCVCRQDSDSVTQSEWREERREPEDIWPGFNQKLPQLEAEAREGGRIVEGERRREGR